MPLVRVHSDRAKAKSPVIRQYEGKDVVLDTANFARFAVEGKRRSTGARAVAEPMIQLAPEAAKHLEDLRLSHMNRPVAS